jgi:hypothetical protein
MTLCWDLKAEKELAMWNMRQMEMAERLAVVLKSRAQCGAGEESKVHIR